jgi:hypothetical protein
MYGRTYGLGFLAPKINGQGGSYTTESGFAKRPILTTATVTSLPSGSGPKITPTVEPPMSTPLRFDPDFQAGEAMRHRYSDDQIREMLARGKSETVERSGESDSGMPVDKAHEREATEKYASDAFSTASDGSPGYIKTPAKKTNLLPVILAGVAAYYFM